MGLKQETIIEGGFWTQVKVAAGDRIRVTAIEGPQVADFWAFHADDMSVFLSAEHTRSTLEKLMPEIGDSLYSNFRYPILTVLEDTSPGTHDMLMSACDPRRYEILGHVGYHRSCKENFFLAMEEAGTKAPELPSPFNIFQNVSITNGNNIAIVPPEVKAGQYLEMKAESDLLIVISACPMDIADTNGPDGVVRPIKLEVFG